MLEKRGDCCCTDGPRRVRTCQMLHTMAAINAAWCRSLRWASSPRASDYAKFITTWSKRWILNGSRTDAEHTIPTVHMHISVVTPARHAQGALSILRAFVACAVVVPTAVLVLLSGGILQLHRPLQWRSVSDKCSVRCRAMKQIDKNYRNFRSNPTFDNVLFCLFS